MSNDTMTAYYTEMNDREERHQLEQQAEQSERDWAKHRDEIAAGVHEAYAQAKDGNGMPIIDAIGTIAGYFYNPHTTLRPRNDEVEANALQFQQRGVLGNMCQNAHWMLENARQHGNKLWAEVDQLEAVCDGSEIGLNKLNYALDRLEDCQSTQIPACEEWFETCKVAYKTIVGDDWKPFAKAGADPKKQTADATRARLERMRHG